MANYEKVPLGTKKSMSINKKKDPSKKPRERRTPKQKADFWQKYLKKDIEYILNDIMPVLSKWLEHITLDKEEAIQECRIKIWEIMENGILKADGNPRSYITNCCVNCCRNLLTKYIKRSERDRMIFEELCREYKEEMEYEKWDIE